MQQKLKHQLYATYAHQVKDNQACDELVIIVGPEDFQQLCGEEQAEPYAVSKYKHEVLKLTVNNNTIYFMLEDGVNPDTGKHWFAKGMAMCVRVSGLVPWLMDALRREIVVD